jgi:hypothetical protein
LTATVYLNLRPTTDKKSIASRSVDNSADSANVLHGLVEQDEIHNSLEIVVFIDFLLEDFLQFS